MLVTLSIRSPEPMLYAGVVQAWTSAAAIRAGRGGWTVGQEVECFHAWTGACRRARARARARARRPLRPAGMARQLPRGRHSTPADRGREGRGSEGGRVNPPARARRSRPRPEAWIGVCAQAVARRWGRTDGLGALGLEGSRRSHLAFTGAERPPARERRGRRNRGLVAGSRSGTHAELGSCSGAGFIAHVKPGSGRLAVERSEGRLLEPRPQPR